MVSEIDRMMEKLRLAAALTPTRGTSFSSSSSGTSSPMQVTTPPPATTSNLSPRHKKTRRGHGNKARPRFDSTSSNKTPVRSGKKSPVCSSSPGSGSECEERFAGARFTLPPSPEAVPLPPAAWFK